MENATFLPLISEFYNLNRTAVNADTDRFVEHIKNMLPCTVLEIPSGAECLTWIVPKRWEVREGYLARLDGTRIVDFNTNPLHLWTHSVSFSGEISRQELERHLYSDSAHPDWIPYHYRNGYKYDAEEWGFSLSYNLHQSLGDDRYYVHIDTILDTGGTMKIIDDYIIGESPDTYFFAAHTCHPAIVTDGMAPLAVGVELFKQLHRRKRLKNSYRLILGPEYFAAAGFLAMIPDNQVRLLKGGIFLDMLGNNQPLGYQTSFQNNSLLDKIVENVFTHHVPCHIKKTYRKLWGNDEMFYNGPGFEIPTLGIAGAPHPEYHFDADNLDLLNCGQLAQSLDILLKIVEVLETDYIPVRKFNGPLYLSRYGVYVDPKVNPQGYEHIEYIQILMDGKRSCFDISSELNIDYFFTKRFCDELIAKGLLEPLCEKGYDKRQ